MKTPLSNLMVSEGEKSPSNQIFLTCGKTWIPYVSFLLGPSWVRISFHSIPMEKWFRHALFVSAATNLLGGWVLIPRNHAARAWLHFPEAAPAFLSILSIWIFAFGFCYFWLALQSKPQWLFVVMAAICKISFFGVYAVDWDKGQISWYCPVSAFSDFLFGCIFAYWAFKHRSDA